MSHFRLCTRQCKSALTRSRFHHTKRPLIAKYSTQSTNDSSKPKKSVNRYFFETGLTYLAGATLVGVFYFMYLQSTSGNQIRAPSAPQEEPVQQIPEHEMAQLLQLARHLDENDPQAIKACARLGFIYFTIHHDPKKAYDYLKKAADKGDVSSMYNLGLVILDMHDKNMDFELDAAHYLELAAQQAHVKAQQRLGRLLLTRCERTDLSKTEKRALAKDGIKWLEEASEMDKEAAFQLGMLYFSGIPDVVPQDIEKAASFLRIAAQKRHPEAMFHFGMAMKNGFGVPQDMAKGIDFIRDAAHKGNALAQYEYGSLLMSGVNGIFPPDQEKAFHYLLDSARAGNMDASYMVAHCLMQGLGVQKNEKEAFEMFQKLAPHDNQAKVSLGVCYAHGGFVEQDFKKAAELWQSVLDDLKLHTVAQVEAVGEAACNLGVCCMHGLGVERNLELARQLFLQAESMGYQPARQKLEELNEFMKQVR